jgi:hypothetical protein
MPSREDEIWGMNAQDHEEFQQTIRNSGESTFVEGTVRTSQGDILVKTPGGGIAAASGTGPYTFGSATCTVVSDAGVVGSETVTVKNIVNEAIAANVIGKASRVGSIWVIDVASCS